MSEAADPPDAGLSATGIGQAMSKAGAGGLDDSIEAHYDALSVYAARRSGDGTLAADAVHDAYLRLAGGAFGSIANPKAFLYRVVSNVICDRQRRQTVERRHRFEAEVLATSAVPSDPERTMAARQDLQRLVQAIDSLPPRCRECFVLSRFEGLATDMIAARMGISRNMVEKHLRHALAFCARSIGRAG